MNGISPRTRCGGDRIHLFSRQATGESGLVREDEIIPYRVDTKDYRGMRAEGAENR